MFVFYFIDYIFFPSFSGLYFPLFFFLHYRYVFISNATINKKHTQNNSRRVFKGTNNKHVSEGESQGIMK